MSDNKARKLPGRVMGHKMLDSEGPEGSGNAPGQYWHRVSTEGLPLGRVGGLGGVKESTAKTRNLENKGPR